jgi:single-strand DNA-binding protein
MDINQITLIGNLGEDAIVRHTQDNKKVLNFSLATNEKWTNKKTNEVNSQTEWHKIVVLNEVIIRHCENLLKKGARVYVEGCVKYRQYTDKNGFEKTITEVIVKNYGHRIEVLYTDRTNKNNTDMQDLQSSDFISEDVPF